MTKSARWTGILLAASILLFPGTSSSVSAHTQKDGFKQRQHIRKRARHQVGAPYRSAGTSPSGFDCSGFTRWVFSSHGASLPHSSSRQFAMARRDGYKRIRKRGKLKVGDLVFHDTGSGLVGHAGIYMGGGRFISATTSEGVRIRSLHDSYWGPRWVGATRTSATQKLKQRKVALDLVGADVALIRVPFRALVAKQIFEDLLSERLGDEL
jgi:cell wall-associated NlpC family hydrolase